MKNAKRNRIVAALFGILILAAGCDPLSINRVEHHRNEDYVLVNLCTPHGDALPATFTVQYDEDGDCWRMR